MKSMTGFGFRETTDGILMVSVELKSYNNRYLDIYAYLPPQLGPLEPRLRDFLAGRIARGRVEASIKLKELEENLSVSVDRGTVRAYHQALKEIASVCGLEEQVHLAHLLRMEGIIKTDKTRDLDSYWQRILPVLEEAFREYEGQRIREGEATARDVRKYLDVIAESVAAIELHVPALESHFKQQLRARFEEIAAGQVDENRILSEVAMLLVKYSINEEVVRLKSHLEGFRSAMQEGGSVGKKLDFLCQELHREINTVGSKSVLVEVSRKAVLVKDALENIREQLRNVE
jgi:uncharacterized protein (TIGR00255 family)